MNLWGLNPWKVLAFPLENSGMDINWTVKTPANGFPYIPEMGKAYMPDNLPSLVSDDDDEQLPTPKTGDLIQRRDRPETLILWCCRRGRDGAVYSVISCSRWMTSSCKSKQSSRHSRSTICHYHPDFYKGTI